jgi:glycosyltransferase involved in cell wall biosynthesis
LKVIHVITDLENGGAEKALFRLITSDIFNHHIIISLSGIGVYGFKLRELGYTVEALFMSRNQIRFKGLWHLLRLLKSENPDVVQTWMYHADLIGGCIARLIGVQKVFWGIRGPYNKARTSLSTKAVIYFCSLLSGFIPSAIVSNSRHAIRAHVNAGYRSDRFVCIPNGYDISTFQSGDSGSVIRKRLELKEEDVLLGMVARFDPYKDHGTLFTALKDVKDRISNLKFVLVGSGMDNDNPELVQMIDHCDLGKTVCLQGPIEDIPNVMAALEIHVLSSAAESFPNVIAEAMATGTPCVTTDVGDASLIVGSTGWVVPHSSPMALKEGILSAVNELKYSENWNERCNACRERIASEFCMDRMVCSFVKLWRDSLNG